jgi:DNA-binding transcriptional ArsR family regulator
MDRMSWRSVRVTFAEMPEPVGGEVLEALTRPIRMALLVTLERTGEATAAELAERLGVSEGAVHQHVAPLHESGLVVDGSTPRHVRVAGAGWGKVAAQIRRLQRLHPPPAPGERDG